MGNGDGGVFMVWYAKHGSPQPPIIPFVYHLCTVCGDTVVAQVEAKEPPVVGEVCADLFDGLITQLRRG